MRKTGHAKNPRTRACGRGCRSRGGCPDSSIETVGSTRDNHSAKRDVFKQPKRTHARARAHTHAHTERERERESNVSGDDPRRRLCVALWCRTHILFVLADVSPINSTQLFANVHFKMHLRFIKFFVNGAGIWLHQSTRTNFRPPEHDPYRRSA